MNKSKFLRVSILIFILCFSYALIRYVVFKGEGLEHVPLYILNKGLALTSVILLGISFLAKQRENKKIFGQAGVGVAVVHTAIVFLLLGPAYYPDFFGSAGKLAFKSELSLLSGMLALSLFSLAAFTHKRILMYSALVAVLLHVAIMGYAKWFRFSDWPGRLPPITLLASALIVFVLVIKGLAGFKGTKRTD